MRLLLGSLTAAMLVGFGGGTSADEAEESFLSAVKSNTDLVVIVGNDQELVEFGYASAMHSRKGQSEAEVAASVSGNEVDPI